MANFLKNFNLPRDPLHIFLVVDLFLLKNFDGDLIKAIHNAFVRNWCSMLCEAENRP